MTFLILYDTYYKTLVEYLSWVLHWTTIQFHWSQSNFFREVKMKLLPVVTIQKGMFIWITFTPLIVLCIWIVNLIVTKYKHFYWRIYLSMCCIFSPPIFSFETWQKPPLVTTKYWLTKFYIWLIFGPMIRSRF